MDMLTQQSVRHRGFTLIEMITVVVILAILAALGGKFVVESTKSYQSVQTRSRLMNTGRQALERMSRQLRIALPYSVQVTNNGSCLEFFPIAAGGIYTTPVADTLNGAAASGVISVAPYTIDFGTANFVSIGAMSATEIYGSGPASRATLSSRSATQLILTAPKTWQRNSINQRFYLLDLPQAFCLVANQLRFYDNQSASSGSVDLSSSYSLLAENATATTPFSLTLGSENRNTVVQLALGFTSGSETITFNHSVMIRNVP